MIIGHLLSDRYEIKRLIGGGGMANVYLAYDNILERQVAIKMLRPEFSNDPEFIERFDREAKASASLYHPNIVEIYDVGEEENILFIVMEYIDGLTLKEYISKHAPIEVSEALQIMKQLTSAIDHAHAHQLIHRDIKPQNILIDRKGNIKITDFGIAVALSSTALTQTNTVLGSVHYLSPEQARGGKATKKSDLYSLGIVFYEILTGQLPFSGQSPVSIALKHLQNETPSVRKINHDIPQSVENIIVKATAKDPFLRYSSMVEMQEALDRALDPEYRNEPPLQLPVETGEMTKAIPIITDEGDQVDEGEDYTDEATRIHNNHGEKKEKIEKEKPKKRRRRWLIILPTFLIVTLLIFIAFILWLPSDVVIPDVIDLEYDEAVEELEALNLKVERKTTFSEDIEEGRIVKTNPDVGRTVKEKSTVQLFVSDGKEKVEFPNYEGKMFSQIERLLKEEGYEEIRVYEVVSDRPVGEIVTQIQPEPNSEVVPSETTVIFEVSGGPQKISLGNLVGLTLEQAKEYAERNDLTLYVQEEYSDTVEMGYVVSQNPSANSEVEEGGEVTVIVSKGQKELPPRSQTVSFTVPFSPKETADGEFAEEQLVQIYVEDMNNDLANLFHESTIKNDKQYELTLVIEENKQAEYRVLRDGDELFHEKIPY